MSRGKSFTFVIAAPDSVSASPPVARCQLSVASFQLPVAKVLTNQQQQQKHSSNISTAATPTQDIQGTHMWGSLDWSRSPAQFGAQPTRSVAAGALREISKIYQETPVITSDLR